MRKAARGGVLSYGGESWEEGSQTPTQHTPKNPCPLTLATEPVLL